MRTILHCDLNNCFASMEAVIDPSLKGRAIAVCGDPSERRGIVLAKSEEAKRYGVATGDPLWLARQKCRHILFVPPHFEIYEQYAREIRKYYESFTPYVETFGIDECWLDVSGDLTRLRRSGLELAHDIRCGVKAHFGLTVSVGVSFNKIFAKLASDLKKPDAVTQIPSVHFMDQIGHLPACALLGVGRSTTARLRRCGITSIGQLAQCKPQFLQNLFGKSGLKLWEYANGLDQSEVLRPCDCAERKSLGRGTTLKKDIHNVAQAWPVFLFLAEQISQGLKSEGLAMTAIQITVRDNQLAYHQFQGQISQPLETGQSIALQAQMLFSQNYLWSHPVRSLTIRAIGLISNTAPRQLELFASPKNATTASELGVSQAIHQINARFGPRHIQQATTTKLRDSQPGFFPNCPSTRLQR